MQSTGDFHGFTTGIPSASKPGPKRNGSVPLQIGRYKVRSLMGVGGFGEVYAGYDEQLHRDVAIKLTHREKVGQNVMSMFLEEACILAELDHQNIVPIYDIGVTSGSDPYIVSKLIDGTDLATRIRCDRPNLQLSLKIVADIADALHYAHGHGIIHRDVKPANILLDKTDRPYLADFGIALRDTELAGSGKITGTIAYMSPEQARGEGHLVSIQSDTYSLGVVLYELLCGRRPFRANSQADLLKQVQLGDVRTPRLFDSSISLELERVCLKALARRPSERYAIAKDFADEVRWLLANLGGAAGQANTRGISSKDKAPDTPSGNLSKPLSEESSKVRPLSTHLSTESTSEESPTSKVIPKGLRSFDAEDADFFLDLLPGPYDRDGVPESINFWKKRIESTAAQTCLRVGLIYGPSGCGKSSLVKAGLLPRLSSKVQSVYVEATCNDTSERLNHAIEQAIPELPPQRLADRLALIRRKRLVPSGGKLLLVIDQFEQWLHGNSDYANTELTSALRQCDGNTIQAIIMVRDEFWLSVSRFLQELDIPIIERTNSVLVDLFDRDHAKLVFSKFGQAFSKLPQDRSAWTMQQQEFLDLSIEGLSEQNVVVPVRLALFAQMMKGRTWHPSTLETIGGVSGVGVAFLDESLGARHTPIQFRPHLAAAREFLKALLPPQGTDLKGARQTSSLLQVRCGYASNPRGFQELVKMLDGDLKLITPVDDSASDLSYELTHDYLVPSLREWSNKEQLATRQGRAVLKLSERSAAWTSHPESKQLPTFTEWLQIHSRTRKDHWTEAESKMMRIADRHHWYRLAISSLLVVGTAFTAFAFKEWNARRLAERDAENLVRTIIAADWSKLSGEIPKLMRFRAIADQKLKRALDAYPENSDESFRIHLALIPNDPSQVDYLVGGLFRAHSANAPLLIDSLRPHHTGILERLWSAAGQANSVELLPVASALAAFAPNDERWATIAKNVSESLISENVLHIATWTELLRPAADHLKPELKKIFLEAPSDNVRTYQIENATGVLTAYAENDITLLHELLISGQPHQFARVFPVYKAFDVRARNQLKSDLLEPIESSEKNDPDRIRSIQIQATAAVALLRLNETDSVLRFLTVDRDPEAITQFVYQIRGRDVEPSQLVECLLNLLSLEAPKDLKRRHHHYLRIYAILLGLGEFQLQDIPANRRASLIQTLGDVYAEHPSRAVHSSTGWLLSRWKENEIVKKVDRTSRPYDESCIREWYVVAEREDESQGLSEKPPIHFTMIVFRAGELVLPSADGQLIWNNQVIAFCDREITYRMFHGVESEFSEQEGAALFTHKWFLQRKEKKLDFDHPMTCIQLRDARFFCFGVSESLGLDYVDQCYGYDAISTEQDPGDLLFENLTLKNPNRRGFRMPTDKEWELGSRGGMETQYSFGSSQAHLKEYAWFDRNARGQVQPAASLRPSPGGLFDMYGSLWERTEPDITAIDSESQSAAILRGGSWNSHDDYCVSGGFGRIQTDQNKRSDDFGFRIVQLPEAPLASSAAKH